ncbi:MAG: thioredoxin family protein [Flexibacteraceae bacterium]
MILDISSIDRLFSWQEYLEFSRNLFDVQGKTTSESEAYNTEEILDYTKLNFARINRVQKKFDLNDNLENTISEINIKWRWIMLAESWCGDVAQVGPVIAQIAESSENIEFSVALRDKNLDLMDQFLTNGGRSIPKLICLDANTYQVIGSWGPRPQALQSLMNNWSSEPLTLMQKAERLHKWYADDKTEHTQLELNEVLKQWIAHSNSLAYTPADSR